MIYALIIFCSAIAVEVFNLCSVQRLIVEFYHLSKKSIVIILSKNISDHRKELVLPVYGLNIFGYTLRIFFRLFLVFCVALLPIALAESLIEIERSLWLQLTQWDVMLLSLVACISYYKVRVYYENRGL